MKLLKGLILASAVLLLPGCSPPTPTQSQSGARPEPPQPAVDGPAEDAPTVTNVPATEDRPGLAVGQRAPAFELADQNGELRTLADILNAGPAALVFYRSADW